MACSLSIQQAPPHNLQHLPATPLTIMRSGNPSDALDAIFRVTA